MSNSDSVKKFEATFESLRQFECPGWFKKAKFGIWSHWGAQSVPMYGDWYARHMYAQGSRQNIYHVRHYGHPSEFGYKDICKLWKAEKFDPEGLMKLFKRAGAKYFIGQAMHHDHFFNYPSKLNRFNSAEMGPMKDICGLWKAAAEKEGLTFGLTEHLGASFSWWWLNKGCDKYGPYKGVPYDGSDPEYADFYFENQEHVRDDLNLEPSPWYTTNQKFRDYWLAVIKEVIDMYQPDLLYSDGGLPFSLHSDKQIQDADYKEGLEAVAHLYNTSIAKYGDNRAVYNQKDRRSEIYNIGILDIEKSQLPGINPEPWQTDTCIGNWFYDVQKEYKQPGHVIEILVDIVAKNGCMLLNILQKPDGTLDYEAMWTLEELAKWFDICGEAIYDTEPWKIFGEGDGGVIIDGFKEDRVSWNSSDIRFTKKGNTVYACMLKWPEDGVAVIRSFNDGEKVGRVSLLGGGQCEFVQSFGVVNVKLPEKMPTEYVNVLAIELE